MVAKNTDSANVDPLADDPLENAFRASLETEYAGVLSAEEIEEARVEARKRLTADAKKTAKQKIIDAEFQRHRLKTGDGYMDEELFIQIDLPPYGDRLVVDGVTYFHGHLYKRPRHVVNSLSEMIARMWDHEADIAGKSMAQKLGAHRMQNFDKISGSKSLSAKEAA